MTRKLKAFFTQLFLLRILMSQGPQFLFLLLTQRILTPFFSLIFIRL